MSIRTDRVHTVHGLDRHAGYMCAPNRELLACRTWSLWVLSCPELTCLVLLSFCHRSARPEV